MPLVTTTLQVFRQRKPTHPGQIAHVLRNRGAQVKGVTAGRMSDTQLRGVQSLPPHEWPRDAVQCVSNDRVPTSCQMQPDLMRSPCTQPLLIVLPQVQAGHVEAVAPGRLLRTCARRARKQAPPRHLLARSLCPCLPSLYRWPLSTWGSRKEGHVRVRWSAASALAQDASSSIDVWMLPQRLLYRPRLANRAL